MLTPTAFFMYTRKATSGFLFFLDGGSITIGAKTQILTAKLNVEAERLQSFSMHGRRTRRADEFN